MPKFMPNCELYLVKFKLESKADKFFRIFKPKECIQGEPFDLHLTFKNNGEQMVKGGTLRFQIKNRLVYDFSSSTPPIEPQQAKTVTISDIMLAETGFVALQNFAITTEDEQYIICKDSKGKPLDCRSAYPFLLATREELYQKYAVVVAAYFSVLATIISVIGIFVTIFS